MANETNPGYLVQLQSPEGDNVFPVVATEGIVDKDGNPITPVDESKLSELTLAKYSPANIKRSGFGDIVFYGRYPIEYSDFGYSFSGYKDPDEKHVTVEYKFDRPVKFVYIAMNINGSGGSRGQTTTETLKVNGVEAILAIGQFSSGSVYDSDTILYRVAANQRYAGESVNTVYGSVFELPEITDTVTITADYTYTPDGSYTSANNRLSFGTPALYIWGNMWY